MSQAGKLFAVVLALLLVVLLPTTEAGARTKRYPVLFVHGIEGTGAQFESQAMRFTSNGYRHCWIDEVDYDSTRATGDQSQVHAQMDAKIAELKRRTGAKKVDLVAHSLGTIVSYNYLTDPDKGAQRRRNVAHYVNIDGQSSNPGVPTLALWAGRRANGPAGHMQGAKNVTIPNQTHVQTCTSWRSFVEMFKFLRGKRPRHDIVRQRGSVQVAGRALAFPQNTGLDGATIQIWALNASGHRATARPRAAIRITDGSQGGGHWGPVEVRAWRRYEFAIVQSGKPTLHYYYEPFVRNDYTLRLLDSDALTVYAGHRLGSVSAVNIRYKELWGDVPRQSDALRINGTNICTASLCPWTKQVNAYFAFDDNRNGRTDLTSDPVVGALPFIQGGDVFIPASLRARGTTTFSLRSRGARRVRTVKTPNWDSTNDGVIVQWRDFEPRDVQRPKRHRHKHRRRHGHRHRHRG